MKRIRISKDIKDNIVVFSVSGIIISIFIFIVLNLSTIFSYIIDFISIISPFLWGLLFAYLGKGLCTSIENHLPHKIPFSIRRFIGSVLTILFIILCFSVIIIIIVPQLVTSISSLANSTQAFINNPDNFKKIIDYFNINESNISKIISDNFDNLGNFVGNFIKNGNAIINSTKDILGHIANFGLGFVIALFFLIERGSIKNGLMFLANRYLNKKDYKFCKNLYNLCVSKFYDYFKGNIIDCVLVGIECFILMSIFRLEYSSLISVIVGITNIIPFFGPFIGGIPSFLLLLIVSPTQAIIFGILVILIQQIDGNFIAPKIIGDSVGVPRLWCMFIIIVAGAYFGFFGMIFGVPIFSVIYTYITVYLNHKKKPFND